MFTDLAFIDWLALVFAAVLLAAVSAAAVIAVVTSSDRPKPLLSGLKRRRSTGSADDSSQETSEGERTVESTWVKPPRPSVRPLHTERHSLTGSPAHAAQGLQKVVVPEIEADHAVAARAAKLRGRPVPEAPGLMHRKRLQSVVSNRTPAHAKALDATIIGGRGGVASDSFDTTEGFKARGPGFFEDPMGRHELRYWDGHTWTEYVKERGERFTDPL